MHGICVRNRRTSEICGSILQVTARKPRRYTIIRAKHLFGSHNAYENANVFKCGDRESHSEVLSIHPSGPNFSQFFEMPQILRDLNLNPRLRLQDAHRRRDINLDLEQWSYLRLTLVERHGVESRYNNDKPGCASDEVTATLIPNNGMHMTTQHHY